MKHDGLLRSSGPFLFQLAISIAIAAAFSFRGGLPGFHHDWIWPATRDGFFQRFLGGMSTWNSLGFGANSDAPALNFVLLFWAVIAGIGANAQAVLFVFIALTVTLGQLGFTFALRRLRIEVGRLPAVAFALAYAFGPVAFQKFAAGHLYFFTAYELLPVFVGLVCQALDGPFSRAWQPAIMAGLILAIMDAQIQYFLFTMVLVVGLIVASRASVKTSIAVLCIVSGIALANIAPYFMNLGGDEVHGLIVQHANLQWEYDLSGQMRTLMTLGGYEGYDVHALPPVLVSLYAICRYVTWLAGLAGVALLFVSGRRRAAVALAGVALFALFWAAGLNGPFESIFAFLMPRTPLFTIAREFYHSMGLYAFWVVVFAAVSARYVPSPFAALLALAVVGTSLPFTTLGANRIVPAVVHESTLAQACGLSLNLCLALPFTPPVGPSTDPDRFGVDPSTLIANSLNAGAPLYGTYAVYRLSGKDLSAVSSLGITTIVQRSDLMSRAPELFEPNVGSDFALFRKEQQSLARLSGKEIPGVALAALEERGATTALDTVPGANSPPGTWLAFTSSYRNNDIRASWVLGSLWAAQFPQYANVADNDIIITKSRTPLLLRSSLATRGKDLYVLAAGHGIEIDGKKPERVMPIAKSKYGWYQWKVGRQTVYALSANGLSAVASAILSESDDWTAPANSSKLPSGQAVTARWRLPWEVEGVLPQQATCASCVLVVSRSYSRGWELRVGNDDRGPSIRVHGFFNGWKIDRADLGKPFQVVRIQQGLVNNVVLAEGLLDVGLLALAAVFAGKKRMPGTPEDAS